MSVPLNLTSNEVKSAAGAEIEFSRFKTGPGAFVQWKQAVLANPSLPFLLGISHAETGAGFRLRRRSLFRTEKTSISGVDSVTPITPLIYTVMDLPVGAMTTLDEGKAVMAAHISMLASLGASTTILYDCTGTAAAALLNGDV